MADESQVLDTLVSVIGGVLYPPGTSLNGPSIAGMPCRVYRGWPNASSLDADLAIGNANVTVFARNGVEQVATRYPRDWVPLSPPVHTVTATIAGTTCTFGGTISIPQNIAVSVPGYPPVLYAVQPLDTLQAIAAAIQALLAARGVACSASGPVLTAPGGFNFARIGGAGTAMRELRRQNKSIQVTIWSAAPKDRDAIAAAIDPAMALLNFITLPDGSSGLVRYERTTSDDAPQKELLWRRDLFYWVEYPTTQVQTFPEVISLAFNATGGQASRSGPTFQNNA